MWTDIILAILSLCFGFVVVGVGLMFESGGKASTKALIFAGIAWIVVSAMVFIFGKFKQGKNCGGIFR